MAEPTNPNDSQPGNDSALSEPQNAPRKAAILFIFVTLLIDILGIGIVIPVLPELIKSFVADDATQQPAIAEVVATYDADQIRSILSEQFDDKQQVEQLIERGVDDPEVFKLLADREYASQASFWGGIIQASYAITLFLFAPVIGALSDRFGRRPILLMSMFGLAVDYLIQAWAPGIGWLFVGRIVAGIMGASFITANAYIADISTDETRARNFGILGVAFGLGFTLGPALGGLLGSYSLRLPFLVAAGLSLLNWLYGFFILPESLAPENRSPFTVAKLNPFGSLLRMKAYPIVKGLAVAIFFVSLAQRGLENVWVYFTGYRYGWDEFDNGMALGLVGIMAIIVQGGMVRPFIKRFGEQKTVIYGISIAVLAFMGYAFASQAWMVYCVIIFGSLGGVAGPAVQSIIAKNVRADEQGQMQGAVAAIRSVTSIFAPLLFTTGLFRTFTAESAEIKLPGIPFFVGSLLQMVALFLAWRLFQRFPQRTKSVKDPGNEHTSG